MKIITDIRDMQVDAKKGKLLVVVFWYATPTLFSNGTLLELDPAKVDLLGIDGAIQEQLPAKVKEQFALAPSVTEIADASSAKSDKVTVTPAAEEIKP